MTINENSTKDAVRSEIQSYFKRLNNTNKNFKVNIMNQPDDYWQSTFRYWTNEGPNIKEIITDFLIMMFALLFVPALNLCGLISSRMENRLCEMGIRKTFGARKNSLILQVVCENLALTAIGAVAGLLLSYIVVLISSDWILNIFSDGGAINTHITFNMLFNPIIIGIAIVICMILNLLSAVIPASLSLRHNIIYSLNTKR
jgi:putative ABC transport system permease protein